jgi:hypothetical protein
MSSHASFARFASVLLLAVSAASLSGCYRVTIKSGRDAAAGVPATDGVSRGGYINGIDEDSPLHAGMACSDRGWSSVEMETSFLNGLVNTFRGVIYHTENVTLRCAAPVNAPAAPPASGNDEEDAARAKPSGAGSATAAGGTSAPAM